MALNPRNLQDFLLPQERDWKERRRKGRKEEKN
jgi:hypothetical protein